MYYNNDFIYLELRKTACSHVRYLLNNINSISGVFNPDFSTGSGHNKISQVFDDPLYMITNRSIIGNIRNPWDWYVSLWSYGCAGHGFLRNWLTRKNTLYHPYKLCRHLLNHTSAINRNRNKWLELYSNVQCEENFRQWLKYILNTDDMFTDLPVKYTTNPFSQEIGLLGMEYLRLYTYNSTHSSLIKNAKSYDENCNIMDLYIRKEFLEEDFIGIMTSFGYDLTEDDIEFISKNKKQGINKSSHKNYEFYYDNTTVEIIQQKELFIIEKHGYKFE